MHPIPRWGLGAQEGGGNLHQWSREPARGDTLPHTHGDGEF